MNLRARRHFWLLRVKQADRNSAAAQRGHDGKSSFTRGSGLSTFCSELKDAMPGSV